MGNNTDLSSIRYYNERTSNKYVISTTFVNMILLASSWIANEMGFFYVEANRMRFYMVASFALLITIQKK